MRLSAYDSFEFRDEPIEHTVYLRRNRGPAVVVMHEIPGITPEVLAFADRVWEEGFTVYLPHLFGTPGKAMTLPYAAGQILRACISRELSVLARHASSPVTDWLRALCRRAHSECGGPGVGAIGMCMTGNFALALMLEPCVLAPVLSQPSLPFALTKSHAEALHVSPEELTAAKRRVAEGCPVLAMRFTRDPLLPAARFATLRRELGDGLEAIEIDSGPGNRFGIPRKAHSVVTNDLVDREGHPTREALDRVLGFFHERLGPVADPSPSTE